MGTANDSEDVQQELPGGYQGLQTWTLSKIKPICLEYISQGTEQIEKEKSFCEWWNVPQI